MTHKGLVILLQPFGSVESVTWSFEVNEEGKQENENSCSRIHDQDLRAVFISSFVHKLFETIDESYIIISQSTFSRV